MAIEIANVSNYTPSPNEDVQGFSCQVIGDNESTSFVLNLSKTPFDYKFTQTPSSVDLVMDGVEGLPDVTGVISTSEIGDVLLTCTLSGTLEAFVGHLENVQANYMTCTFIYNA